MTLDEVRLKDNLSSYDKVRAFTQACRQSTVGAAHALAYVGTYPLSAHEFLDALFSTQSGFRPKDAFGFDGMRRQALALAPSPPFKLESFLFDASLQPIVHRLNMVIVEFESFRKAITPKADELVVLHRSKTLTEAERNRKHELEQTLDVLFIKTFNEEHARGVLREKKTSNAAAADALKKALPIYPTGDPRREQFEELEQRLRAALKDFDHRIDVDIAALSRQPSNTERVYHAGDSLYLFLKGIGAANPKLRTTLTIRRLSGSEPSVVTEQPFEVFTRAYDDPPEMNRQHNVAFATEYQRYWVSFFSEPVVVAGLSSMTGLTKQVVENRALIAEAPGDYIATLELFDETTKSTAKIESMFSVVP